MSSLGKPCDFEKDSSIPHSHPDKFLYILIISEGAVAIDPWVLVFRAEAGNGMSVYQRWTTSEYNSPTDPACQEFAKNNCPDHYRHELLDGYSSVDFETMNKVSMNVDVH